MEVTSDAADGGIDALRTEIERVFAALHKHIDAEKARLLALLSGDRKENTESAIKTAPMSMIAMDLKNKLGQKVCYGSNPNIRAINVTDAALSILEDIAKKSGYQEHMRGKQNMRQRPKWAIVAFLASNADGLSTDQLAEQAGYSKNSLNELLKGNEMRRFLQNTGFQIMGNAEKWILMKIAE